MGIQDGRNLENRSVALLKLEVDVIPAVSSCTVGNFPIFATGGVLANSAYRPSSFSTAAHNHDTQYISIITSPVTGNIPVMTAGGELNTSTYTIGNATGNVPISNGTVCVNLNADLLDGHEASYFSGSAHNHDSQYISIITSPTTGAIPFMTAGGELTTSAYIIGHGTGNVPTNAGSGTLNTDLNADFLDGYHASAFAPAEHVGATGSAHGVVTTSVDGFMTAADKTKLNGIAAGAGATAGVVAKGAGAFAGSASHTVVNFTPAASSVGAYEVGVTPKADPSGNLGEFFYVKQTASQFWVYNTGSAVTDFSYQVVV